MGPFHFRHRVATAFAGALALGLAGLVTAGTAGAASQSPASPAAAKPGAIPAKAGPVPSALSLPQAAGQPDLGPNVYVFTPATPLSQIQSIVDAIASQQISNQFGTQRYALLFEPGTYGTADRSAELPGRLLHPGRGPGRDAGRRGDQRLDRRVQPVLRSGNCIALDNFWRSLSNLTINVNTPGSAATSASSGPSRRPRRCAACTSTGR